MTQPPASLGSERVLVFVRGARERSLTLELLESRGLEARVCEDANELCRLLDEGAGAALLAEEMLSGAVLAQLEALLAKQPPWSDFPLVIFSSLLPADGARLRSIALLGNVTFLDRPVRVRSMLASMHAALRSRRRQYEARRAIESRDAFLAMLGHELRNPLGAITLASSLLAKKTDAPLPPEYAIIQRQSRHLTRLVDDLLDVARVTHGKVAVERARLDLAAVVRGALETFTPRAEEQRLKLELRGSDVRLWVDGDRQRLEQVLGNLLGNAIKYTPPGGRIVVEASSRGGEAIVEVRDTGVGLAPEMLDRVFEPFAQVDTSLDRAQGGLGLGLSLVRSIAQLHGGSIRVSSAGLGQGSTFTLTLPQVSGPHEDGDASGPATPARLAKRVLVVEDNDDIRELLTEILVGAGHEVTSAADGPEGLNAILSWSPDIAFVDVGLPGFDGLELARRARSAGAPTHLVALTGYGQSEDKRRTAAAGFDDHLVKPVIDADIARAILRANAS